MRARSILQIAWAQAMALALAASASAVIIDSGDGTGNTTAPDPDPGWRNVGTIGGLSGLYLGGKFVLTAAHVGWGNVVLDGVTYVYVPGTAVQLDNGDDPLTYADLLMFQIYPEPPLPALSIASLPPLAGTGLILAGHGVNRGPPTSWDPPDPPPNDFIDGYEWGAGNSMRWGTNKMDGLPFLLFHLNTYTMAYATDFDEPGPTRTAHECQAAVGDSGGAVFTSTSTPELAGILFLIGGYPHPAQPANIALYGNKTYSVDLSSYRDQILDVMAMPEPSGGLWPGAAVVALLERRRRARPRRAIASDALKYIISASWHVRPSISTTRCSAT